MNDWKKMNQWINEWQRRGNQSSSERMEKKEGDKVIGWKGFHCDQPWAKWAGSLVSYIFIYSTSLPRLDYQMVVT